jgi:hypothetical protein
LDPPHERVGPPYIPRHTIQVSLAATSMAAISIFFIVIIASKARLASPPPPRYSHEDNDIHGGERFRGV